MPPALITWLALAALLAHLIACGASERGGAGAAQRWPRGSAAGPTIAPAPHLRESLPVRIVDPQLIAIEVPGVTGLSDLTADDTGRLWAVAERARRLVRMQPSGGSPRVVALEGVPDRLDVEGIAWLGGGRFALATEADSPRRSSDLLLFARLTGRGTRVVVERQVALDYRLWPIEPRGNQGMEGLCKAGGALVVAIESVVGSGERRQAPVAVHHLASAGWTPYLVRLTTTTGKLSALSCRERGGAIDVMAVERHFEVARLIRFELPAPAPSRAAPAAPVAPVEINPVLVANLAPLIEKRENLEGLVWDGERSIVLVADNDWVAVVGPNLLVRAGLSGPAPAPPPARARRPPPAPRATSPASPPAPRRR
jgi:hypothetical protein